ncbi:MAG: methyltransferase family protein [Pseudanabaenaceae cyanobacterium]
MHKLQEWGLTKDWWRNQRGEYWVIGQTILSVAYVLLPSVSVFSLPFAVRISATVVLGGVAFLLGFTGLFALGDNLTPLPHPKEEGTLITTGAYRFVRHPLYSSVIFLALAYAVWLMSITHLVGVLFLVVFFDRKAAQEEKWLTAKFPEYEEYRRSVQKLLPGIY